MSDSTLDSEKRHRHDVGDVAHGAKSQEALTRGIQGLLGLWIIGTAALVVFAIVWAAVGPR